MFGRQYYQDLEACLRAAPLGWADLVRRAWELTQAAGADVLQVKEKFGGLRFYHAPAVDGIEEIEAASYTVCQICGAAGELRDGEAYPDDVHCRWLYTLCDEDFEKLLATLRSGGYAFEAWEDEPSDPA